MAQNVITEAVRAAYAPLLRQTEEALCLLGCTCRAGTICYLHDPAMDKIIEAHWTDAKQIERWTKARALSAALREALREQP